MNEQVFAAQDLTKICTSGQVGPLAALAAKALAN
jgi:hypothetical protein